MELKQVILAVACFSCLVPSALGTGILAAKAAAAAKGALLAKGLAVKGAAVAAVKGAAVKGVSLLAKGVAAKGAAVLAAKGAAIKGAALGGAALLSAHKIHHKPLVMKPIAVHHCPQAAVVPVATVSVPAPGVLSHKVSALSSLWGSVKNVVDAKTNAVGHLLDTLKEKVTPHVEVQVVAQKPHRLYDYEIVRPADFYPMPVPISMMQRVEEVYV